MVAVVATLFFIDPIPQDPKYHLFADARTVLGIPNFANVISNFLFVIYGALGLISINRAKYSNYLPSLKKAYWFLFFGIFLTGFGSAYYHWLPTNATLVWDRLPMAVAFMALFTIIIGEQVEEELALKVFGPLLIFGIFSIAYWYFTEQKGLGDLRIYVLVQFLPILIIPLLLLFYPSPYNTSLPIWLAIAMYALAKAFELSDRFIYELGLGISGHSIKHIFAALGGGCLLWGLQTRRLVSEKHTI